MVYDSDTFEELGQIDIELPEQNTRELSQVLAIQKSHDEEYIALITGKILIMNEQKPSQLIVYRRVNDGMLTRGEFELVKSLCLEDFDVFQKVCMKYHFKAHRPYCDTLLFTKIDQIFQLNYMTEEVRTIYDFSAPFLRQPLFFTPNADQTIFLIASPEDAMYLNILSMSETDIDHAYSIDSIKEVIYDPEECYFYVLANKYKEKLGFYVIRLSEAGSAEAQARKFLIKWKNKLDIGDPNMFLLHNDTG